MNENMQSMQGWWESNLFGGCEMIEGMQGFTQGDAAWHREQLGHTQMALADAESLVLGLEERIEKQAALIEQLSDSIKALQGNLCGDYSDEICADALVAVEEWRKK